MSHRLETWTLGKLKPFDRNAREITIESVDKLAAVIEAQGFLAPIEATEAGEILAGHRRLLAAKKLKLKAVPVLIHEGLTDDQARAYRIASNRLAEDVDWAKSLLTDELVALEALGWAPDSMGFEDADIVKLFDLAEEALPTGKAEAEVVGPFLRASDIVDIGPVQIVVNAQATEGQLRTLEGAILKMSKLLKSKPQLDGQDYRSALAERALQQGVEV